MRFIKLNYAALIPKRNTKDKAKKFEDMLADIGGSIGLLIGFSMITAVETVYFVTKIAIELFFKCGQSMSQRKTK